MLHADLTADITSTRICLHARDKAMFVIAELKDTIRVPPWLFKLKLPETVRDEINRKLANKVRNGLRICPEFTFHSQISVRSSTMWDCV